ncbi:hypothetical protein BDY19DRAFT_977838 [Irpex rosettiformis]|uniref:Uncharacterized protein n=1 Tax=Irpex rosettiformis TaxID=378272 RepID=A0ACB8TNE0_9APHY|nr:hypothetical protein BDY19DRAFT_977838 [Irpex rosettiformis]
MHVFMLVLSLRCRGVSGEVLERYDGQTSASVLLLRDSYSITRYTIFEFIVTLRGYATGTGACRFVKHPRSPPAAKS